MVHPNIAPRYVRTIAGLGAGILLLAGCSKATTSNENESVAIPSERVATMAAVATSYSCDFSTFISGKTSSDAPNGSMNFQASSTGAGKLSMIRFTALEKTTGSELTPVDAAPDHSAYIVFPHPDEYTVTATGYADTTEAGEIAVPCQGGLQLSAGPGGLGLLATL